MDKNFLFVAGCARSGTSALVQLLSGSKKILLGMERFGHLVGPNSFSLNKSHFEKERFYELHEGDTFYKDLGSFHGFDSRFFSKYDEAKWIGDKRPDLYEAYDQLFASFPGCKVIFIYRDLIEVASSYHGRVLEGKNWPASKDFKAAVREWNRSLFMTREAIAKGYDVHVVYYKDVFCSDKDLSPIFNLLGVNVDDDVKRQISMIKKRSQQLSEERKMLLSEEELAYIQENSKPFLINDMLNRSILE